MAQVNLNVTELKSFINHIITNNRFLQEEGKNSVSVEVVGESGIGKTSTIVELAQDNNLNFVKVNLAQIEELGDLVGFPVRQFQMYKETTVSQKTNDISYTAAQRTAASSDLAQLKMPTTRKVGLWVDELAVQEYLKNGYKMSGKNRMSYCPPEWISDKKEGGILLLDDWNRADTRFIQAVMELIDRQTYISWTLPKDWHIMLTANPDNGDYLVQSIDTAQRTRFISINLKFDAPIWARWAEKESVDNRCINFLLLHEELITTQTNARSVTNFFNSISSIKNFTDSLPLIQMIGEGSVGSEFTTMFTTFIHNKLDMIIHPKEVLLNENEDHIISELKKLLGKDDKYRADIASIITSRIINYSLEYATEHTITKPIISRLITLSTVEDVLNNDLQYVLIKKLLAGNKVKFQKIMEDSKVLKMATKL